MSSIKELLEAHENIRELWASLEEKAPDEVRELRELLALKTELESGAKTELRQMGPGKHTFGDTSFTVKEGGNKSYVDPEDFVIQAHNRDEMDFLLQAGVLTYTVNMTQYERLPEETKAGYADLVQEKKATHRVYIPKDLCR